MSATQSTLYDQIEYSGSPSSFAWVLAHPRHGDRGPERRRPVRFDRRADGDADHPPASELPGARSATASVRQRRPAAAGGRRRSDGRPVQVLAQANVGPYATVQLHSTDSSALDAWLTTNGFNIPAAVQPILDAYVKEGFDFLAMKLLPNQGVQAMRPVRVTTPGASLSLPLRMASDRHRRRHRHHDLGRRRRPLRAAELPVLSHRRQPARVGLEQQHQQLHDAARAERGEAQERRLGDRELDRPQRADDQERHPERRPVLRQRPGLERCPSTPRRTISRSGRPTRAPAPTAATRAPSKCATTTSTRSSPG